MKKLLIIIFWGYSTIFGQYPGLYSEDFEIVLNELEDISNNNDYKAIDILHESIENQAPYIQYQYLLVLSKLRDIQLEQYIFDFIDRSDDFINSEYREDPLSMKVEASKLLIERGNFSTINYISEYFNLYKPDFNSIQRKILDIFPQIYINVPSIRPMIKDDLMYVFNNATIMENRLSSLINYEIIFGDEVINLALLGITDDTQSIRYLSIEFLIKYDYYDLDNLLKEKLVSDPGRSMRTTICDLILSKFGNPADLKYCIDYQPTEPNETSRSLMNYSIKTFIPPRPTVTTAEMIENLIVYNDELFQYGWITRYSDYSIYKRYLEKIQAAYGSQSLADLCENLNILLQLAENQWRSFLITEEAYKFLHYHGTYIKENVESELGTCEERKK